MLILSLMLACIPLSDPAADTGTSAAPLTEGPILDLSAYTRLSGKVDFEDYDSLDLTHIYCTQMFAVTGTRSAADCPDCAAAFDLVFTLTHSEGGPEGNCAQLGEAGTWGYVADPSAVSYAEVISDAWTPIASGEPANAWPGDSVVLDAQVDTETGTLTALVAGHSSDTVDYRYEWSLLLEP